MLELDDPRWYSLEHASGFASDIPELLQRLKLQPTPQLWDRIWDKLLIDMAVYPATVAIVPHLVMMAKELPPHKRHNHLIFVGMVAAHYEDATIPDDLDSAYREALKSSVLPLLEAIRLPPMDERILIHLLASLASVCGNDGLGRIMSGLIRGEFSLACPHCEGDLFVSPDEQGFRVYAPDPYEHEQHGVEVEPRGPMCHGVSLLPEHLSPVNAHQWLPALATRAGYPGLAERIHHLHGCSACPLCGHPLGVVEQIVERATPQ